MDTAATVITKALRLFGIIDQMEDPTPADLANGVPVLNDLLRSEHADGACQYTITTAETTLPVGVSGQVYTFTIGNGASFTLNADAVAMRQMWVKDINIMVNRETRPAPKADVVRTTFPSMITRWHQERRVDGSILVYAGQPPRTAVRALIEYGGRIKALTAADGSDSVELPPEGIADAVLLFGRRVAGSYGKTPDPVIAGEAAETHARWKGWANGQQWLRYVRS